MKRPKKGQKVRFTHSDQGYLAGKIYTIAKVDPSDNTLTATDPEGSEGGWIPWSSCELSSSAICWNWLKEQLSGEALELLNAFEGLDHLSLKSEVRDQILSSLPNLKERILQAQIQLEDEQGGNTNQNPS
jgi:hypothetical protein